MQNVAQSFRVVGLSETNQETGKMNEGGKMAAVGMGKYIGAALLIVLGAGLFYQSVQMKKAMVSQEETRYRTVTSTETVSNKGKRAVIGAGAGGILCGVAAFVVGGIGVAACGTGIGAPAGAGLIAAATAIGAGGGAVAGAATGTTEVVTKNTQVPYIVSVEVHRYLPGQCSMIMWLGVSLLVIGCVWWIVRRRTVNRLQTL